MKKLLTLITVALLLLSVCAAAVSCSSADSASLIAFGEKYRSNDNAYYMFNADHTGVYVCKYTQYSTPAKTDTYTVSGSVDFVWREGADGSIYLFTVATHYNEEHSEDKTISIITAPLVFGDGFFAYTRHSEYGSSSIRFIQEGSDLAKALDNE